MDIFSRVSGGGEGRIEEVCRGERREESERVRKVEEEREEKGKRVSANGLFVFEFLRRRRVASRSSIHGCS